MLRNVGSLMPVSVRRFLITLEQKRPCTAAREASGTHPGPRPSKVVLRSRLRVPYPFVGFRLTIQSLYQPIGDLCQQVADLQKDSSAITDNP
jgi:hypothetical protein